ncbi:MAG: DUF1961 family protein [Lentisphaeria bacterium]|nr:DUF1961 family protein [Lentisphaeria bacterium]
MRNYICSCLSCMIALPLLAADLQLGVELAARCGQASLSAEVGKTTPSLRITLPETVGNQREGTAMMEIRASRRIGHTAKGQRLGNLVNGPGIRVLLQEAADGPRFLIRHPGTSSRPSIVCRFAWLAPNQWHHVAVAWNAATGDVDIYVNGWAQQRTHLRPWNPTGRGGVLDLGGILGEGADSATIQVRNPELHAWHMNEPQLRAALRGRVLPDGGEGVRRKMEKPLDLSGLKLTPIFEPDFTKPLPLVLENDLFNKDKRIREPNPGQWVLEGPAKAFTREGELTIDNLESGAAHVVLWLPRAFPESFLLEYDITIEQPDEGLAILFCAARPVGDPTGSIFKPGLARRNGVFGAYIKGDVNSYHISYLSAGKRQSGIPGARRTANVRKNSGFWLVACGDDQIQGHGYGRVPHHVRLLKLENRLQVEVNGKLSVRFTDDGETWGPVWGDGYIGLRQMNHTLSATYRNLRVHQVENK